MSDAVDQIRWKPMRGFMNPDEARTLGISPIQGRDYMAMWFFNRPLIVQRDPGIGITTMSKAVQERALVSCGLRIKK